MLLILAGVTINAVINGGIFDQANYAGVLTEIASVKEAVEINKMTNNQVATKGNMTVDELNNNKDLKQEIGYYRVYAITKTKPDINQDFSGEFMETPQGVADLKYLDNGKLGLKETEKYLYDNVNKMIYKTKGTKIKGQLVFSDIRAKELNDKNYIVEIGQGIAIIPEAPGKINYKLIADNSQWLYKHYNNGDVYAMGKKAPQINTSTAEIEKVDPNKWVELKINDIIGDYIKIETTVEDIFVIDKNNELWAWGENRSNKYGLTDSQRNTFTNRTPIKLNVNGKKVKEIFCYDFYNIIVITTDNEVYGCGKNSNYNFGLGHNNLVNGFIKLDIANVENIETIQNNYYNTLIKYKNETYFYAGKNSFGELGIGSTIANQYYTFKQIWNEGIYDIDQDIKNVESGCTTTILKKDGTLIRAGVSNTEAAGGSDLEVGNNTIFRKFKNELGTNVVKIWSKYVSRYILRINALNEQEVWAAPGTYGFSGSGISGLLTDDLNKYYKINLPEELKKSGIKEIYSTYSSVYYIANNGSVFAHGAELGLGDNLKTATEMVKLNISQVSIIDEVGINNMPILKGNDGKIYITNKQNYMYQNNIVTTTWKKIASNVKKILPGVYIDNTNNLWVAGNNKSILGLGSDETISVPEYIKNTDENIQGKVKDIKILQNNNLFVLTTNNELYSTGLYHDVNKISGWNDTQNKISFVKILDNVKFFEIGSQCAVAITNNNEWYGWGGISTYTYMPSTDANIPTKFNITNVEINKITNMEIGYRSIFITDEDGNFYSSGNHSTNARNGLGYSTTTITKHDTNIYNNEKVKKIQIQASDFRFVLTESGNVYGWGFSKYLGMGDSTEKEIVMPTKCDISDVYDIICGDSYTIVVKNNGEVWGTGNNLNGILGRWIDKNGKYATSRYQTAYEWVRCVDLEK